MDSASTRALAVVYWASWSGHAVGVVAHLGDGLREPAVDGAVHEQVGEGVHEDEGEERDQDGSPEHAGAEACAEDAGALVGVDLEDVADEQDEGGDEEEEGDGGEGGEDEDLEDAGGVEEVEAEGVEGGERGEEEEEGGTEGDGDELAPVRGWCHGAGFPLRAPMGDRAAIIGRAGDGSGRPGGDGAGSSFAAEVSAGVRSLLTFLAGGAS